MYEGMAKNLEEAQKIAASGKIEYAPCHHFASVGPMAGLISPSFMVYEVENKTYGICRVTGKLIPKERLRAVPHATLSIEAKQAR